MNKRKFLKLSALAGLAVGLGQMYSCGTKKATINKRYNWAGNLSYGTDRLHQPATVEALQKLIKDCKKLRALGTTHCFDTIADSAENQVSTSKFNKILQLDAVNKTITVGAGLKYGEFCEYLHKNGFALHNLASLPHISVGGACATSTHGSGLAQGSLATQVLALKMVNGKGEVVSLTKANNPEEFALAVVHLGALGIVTELTLAIQPTFTMKQIVYQNLPMQQLEANFEKIMTAGYSVSLFTDYTNQNISEVWIKDKADKITKPEKTFFGATLQTKHLHPIESLDAINCTEQMAVEGPWYERMPHFKMGFTPSSGKELQAEYFVVFEHAYEGLKAITSLQPEITPHLFITEIRAIAADTLPMSPMYNKACVAFHFTWKQETEAVMALLPKIEKALEPYSPRPHWGKLFTLSPKILQSRISKLSDFKILMEKHDPEAKFRNDFINYNLFS
jgi:alditol oxidase